MASEAQNQVTGPIITEAAGLSLVGKVVRWRPFYNVPTGPSSLGTARSPWTRRVMVIDGNGSSDVLTVTVMPGQTGPWSDRAFANIRELHDVNDCTCPACAPMGDGIHEPTGA
jgi:hypothetical protein